ncbi:MAG: dynamin family protein [Candidatus Korobacteraceae bacterium]
MHDVEEIPIPSRASVAQSPDARALDRLAAMAEELGEGSVSADVRQLVARINEGRFFVACVGQFKRGKSTLLDAFIGEQILPTGVVPVTAVPTVLRYGDERTARVLIDTRWRTIQPEDLPQYVSEELNPENSKQVAGVEVFLPSSLLASGMCLVDTPGIGSVFSGNTETTRDFIPQIDAAILVVGADPPISGEELALIEAVAVNVDEILIVLNKIDRVSAEERQQASEFATKVLEGRLKRPVGKIYEVSALNRLTHAADAADWNNLIENLQLLASKSGQAMTRSAAERGMRRFSASLQRSIDERVRALKEPIANSEQRIASLRQTVSQAEQSLRDLGALFSAEQMRLSMTLLARRKEFLRRVLPIVAEEFEQETSAVATTFGPARRRELMAIAQVVARRHVMPWLDTEETQAEELYRTVTHRFVNLVNGLLQRISEEQGADFSHLPKSLDAEHGFRTRSRFFFHDMITIAQPASPLLFSMDFLMGALHIRHWVRTDAANFLEHLLEINAARVQGDVEQRVVESRLHLESDVRKLLREVSASAEQALSKARELMAAGTNAVQEELERLRMLREELSSLAAVR